MPNWCENYLSIRGPKDALDEIAETGLSFQKLVPCPEELTKFEKVIPVPKSEKKARAEMMKKYGVDTQFDWQVKNWGTKWDIGEQDITVEEWIPGPGKKNEPKEYEIALTFDSAWSPPVPVVESVWSRYKDRGVSLYLEYFEPGCRFLGYASGNKNGFEDCYREFKTADELVAAAKELSLSDMVEGFLEFFRETEKLESKQASKDPPVLALKTASPKKVAKKAPPKAAAKPKAKVAAKKKSPTKTAKKPAIKAAKK